MIGLQLFRNAIGSKPVAIVGLGTSGLPVFEACRASGINTILWDDDPAQRAAAEALGGTVKDMTVDDLRACAFVCLSPGIPLTHPKPHAVVGMAKAAGVPVIGDMEIFRRAKPNARVIAITGTNGKSTTTALVGHILKSSGIKCAVGGNIGDAVLSLPDLPDDGVYVLELSSYQIDLLDSFTPEIAAHINFGPDHLERHGGMEGYIAAKEKLFRGTGTAIIGVDDEWSKAMFERLKKEGNRKTVPVSCQRPLMSGVFASAEGMMFDSQKKIFNIETCQNLKGVHNWQNAAIAYAAAKAAGASTADIVKALQSFPGLKHRQNIVAVLDGINFINDSKATNDQAAAVALKTYHNIYWIAGGKSKGGGYAACESYLNHLAHAFLIGEAENEMAEWLQKKSIPFTRCGTLNHAVKTAYDMARGQGRNRATILLSPACASFDQFKGFEERGNKFIELVETLPQKSADKDAPKGKNA